MKRVVDIYIESISGSGDYSKIELFNDEKIELTSSIQNIQDISKVYTDFTQSFTIPASTINNAIFHHFYQSDVDVVNNGWNFNFRIRARIEIDLVPFRTGTIMMEKANIKNGRTDSYTITFYGDLVSLKDKFGESKLSELDFTAYDINYTATNVIDRVTTTGDQNLMFPLISSKNLWSYGDATSTDITTSTGAISYSELFPALKVARIFDAIEAKFDVTFNSQFFVDTNDKWEKLYLWLKDEESYSVVTSPAVANILTPNGQLSLPNGDLGFYFDASNNTFTCRNLSNNYTSNNKKAVLYISINNISDVNVEYNIDVYKTNGYAISTTYTNKGNVIGIPIKTFFQSDNDSIFYLSVTSKSPITFTLDAVLQYPSTNFKQGITFSQIVTTGTTNISSKVPDIKIADFFSGVLKMFNATCYATSVDEFTIEPLDMWYNEGAIYDITRYTDIDSIDVERPIVFKKLDFKYQKSESFVNGLYFDKGGMEKEYANTNITLSNEGQEYTIELPFESLLMENKNADDFQVGYALTKAPDYKPYIPKPVLFYYDESVTDSIYLNNGTTSTAYTNINMFSNSLSINGVRYSLTWHPEYDVKAPNLQLENNLYLMYYNSYLQNLFDAKARLIRVQAHFPLSLITKLRLNDRLIIRDKRYIINELKSDITSGEVNLVLLNDFRPMINDSITDTIIIPSGGGTVTIPWKVPVTWTESVTFSSPISGVTFSPGTITTSTNVGVTAPVNTNTPTPIELENGSDIWVTDDGYGIINEEGSGVIIPVEATNNNYDGTTSVYTLNLYQE
jgi:hypothetical protein